MNIKVIKVLTFGEWLRHTVYLVFAIVIISFFAHNGYDPGLHSRPLKPACSQCHGSQVFQVT